MTGSVLTVADDGKFVSILYTGDRPAEGFWRMAGGVLVDWRRRGIGTLWLRWVRERMVEAGRERLRTNATDPDTRGFVRHVGFHRVCADGGGRLAVEDVDRERMARWEADLERRAPGIRLQLYPDDLEGAAFDDFVEIRDRFPDVGEMPGTQPDWRKLIERLRGKDGLCHTMLAREADGTLVGVTQLYWRPENAGHVIQEFTGVVPTARGRGIGKALKAAMLRYVLERHHDVKEIGTTNDTANAPILSINERMGFRRVVEIERYEISRDDLDAWLATRDG
jgi:GNAT superfamily N-acetyltransferase